MAAALTGGGVGCGRQDTIEISGQVTFDGAPIEKGEISFIPVDGASAAEGAVIENGTFALAVKPGAKRVEIRASRPLPPERQTNPEMGLMYEDYVPAKYNRESELKAEVTADGDRQFPFALQSQP
jgi:hypothetical protein